MKPPREQDILRACLQLLKLRGHLCWRQNQAAFSGEHKGKRRFFKSASIPGIADIVGCLSPDGAFLAVECKMPGNTLTAHQQAFLAAVEASGGVALVVTSVAELEAGLRKAGY